jgi:hypothetical protein
LIRAAAAALAAVLLIGSPLPIPAATDAECLKRVFNRHCLGGDIGAAARRHPPVLHHVAGERTALVYDDGPEPVYVLGWRGTVYKVVRRYRVASRLRYDELRGLLQGKYGGGRDRSRFAPSADTPGRRRIAIRRGEGRAAHHWRGGEDWRIELSWTRELGLALAYIADDLDRQQGAALRSGF